MSQKNYSGKRVSRKVSLGSQRLMSGNSPVVVRRKRDGGIVTPSAIIRTKDFSRISEARGSNTRPRVKLLRPNEIRVQPGRPAQPQPRPRIKLQNHPNEIRRARAARLPGPALQPIPTEFFKKAIELLNISVPDPIGIGILSFNRVRSITRLLDSIRKFTDLSKITVVVSDESTDNSVKKYLRPQKDIVVLDNAKRIGIAGNTNRLLRYLAKFKYKIVFNDDVEIMRSGWERLYPAAMISIGYHHFCMRQNGIYGASRSDGKTTTHPSCVIQTVPTKPHGAVMAFDNVAFDKVGYFDESFGIYGMEHVDWSNRVSISKIQPTGFHDVVGSEQFFKIHNDRNSMNDNKEKVQALSVGKNRYKTVASSLDRIYVKPSEL